MHPSGEVIGEDYALEYGTDRLEMHVGHVKAGQRVLLVRGSASREGGAGRAWGVGHACPA